MAEILQRDVAWCSRQRVVRSLIEACCKWITGCRCRDGNHRDGSACWAGIGMPIKQRQYHRCAWIADDDWPQKHAPVAGDGVCTGVTIDKGCGKRGAGDCGDERVFCCPRASR